MENIDEANRAYDAWACGSDLPVATGHTGTSASGWVIKPVGQDLILEAKQIASTTSNRRVWEAGIMAVMGVVEFVLPGASVIVRMNDKALINAINDNFRKTDGKPMAGEEFWSRLQGLRNVNRLRLKAVQAEANDETMEALRRRVRTVAEFRLDQLGEAKALRDAVGPAQKPSRGGDFPPIEGGYVEKPNPIRRKKPRRDR